MRASRKAWILAGLAAVVIVSCGGNAADPVSRAEAALKRILLGSGHYPPEFIRVQRPVVIDLTEPLAVTAACQTIGLPADQIAVGPVLGDTYLSNSLFVTTAALRAASAGAARALLDELGSTAGKACLGTRSSDDGAVKEKRYAEGDIDVLEIRDTAPARGVMLTLLARRDTVVVGWFSRGDVDERLVDLIVARLAERLSGKPRSPEPIAR